MSGISIQYNEIFGKHFGNKYNIEQLWEIIILIILILCIGGGLYKIFRGMNHSNLGVYEQINNAYTGEITDLVLNPESDFPLY